MCVYSWSSFSTQLLLTHSSAPQIPAPLVSLNSYLWLISVRPCALLALHSKHYLPPGRKMMPSHALYFPRDCGIALWSNSQKFSFLTSNNSFFFFSIHILSSYFHYLWQKGRFSTCYMAGCAILEAFNHSIDHSMLILANSLRFLNSRIFIYQVCLIKFTS